MNRKELHQDRVMSDLVRGSDEYFRKHPEIAKAAEIDIEKSQKARDQWQIEHYGTVTRERDSRYVQYRRIVAVPVEIEVKEEIDRFVKGSILEELGMTYAEWVEQCYHERMVQILTDPAEFGKIVLPALKRGHVFQEDSLDSI